MASLKKFISQRSIKWKIILIIFCVCIPSTLIGLSAVSYFDVARAKDELKNNLKVSTEMTSDHLSASLAFGDAENAGKILEAFNHNESVFKACLYSVDGRLFASFLKQGFDTTRCPDMKAEQVIDTSDFIVQKSLIQEKGLRNLGSLFVYANLDKISQLMYTQMLFVSGCFLVVLLLVSYPLAQLIQKTVSKPVNDLFEKSKAISQISTDKLRSYNTFDEVYLSIQILEEIRSFAEVYYESIEATETALSNQKHLIDMLNDKIRSRKHIHDIILKNLNSTSYDSVLEVAEHSLEMQTILHLETEKLLELFAELHEAQKSILQNDPKTRVSYKELEYILKAAFGKMADTDTPVFINSADPQWSAKIYEKAALETLKSAQELFAALMRRNLEYRVYIEVDAANHRQINLTLEHTSNVGNEPAFDFDNKNIDVSFLKIKYFNNISNPNPRSVQLNIEEEKVSIILNI